MAEEVLVVGVTLDHLFLQMMGALVEAEMVVQVVEHLVVQQILVVLAEEMVEHQVL